MIRNSKILWVAVVAILAVTAVMASAAQASDLTAGSETGHIKATQSTEQVFTTTAGTVRCTTSNQEGTYSKATIETLEVSATYAGCKAFGFLSATVNMGTCKYRFTGKNVKRETQAAHTALVDIICPTGDITVTTLSCTVHVPGQNELAHVVFANNLSTKPDDVDATVTIEKIKYTETAGCPNVPETKTTENGTFTGGATVKAFNTANEQVDLTSD